MSRLPTVGGDDNTWGNILNDFLDQSHNTDGTLKGSAVSSAGAEMVANKGQANGYAPLDNTGKIPSANLPITTTPDATTTSKGIVQLAGDLSGTAAAPTVPGLASKVDESTVTAKGDILAATGAAAISKVSVGTDGQVLTSDSTKSAGVSWIAPGSGSNLVNSRAITHSNSPYTPVATDDVLFCDPTTGSITINLPTAVGNSGRQLRIMQTTTTDATNGPFLTVTPNGTETVNGVAGAIKMSYRAGGALHIISGGANWQLWDKPDIWTGTGTLYVDGTNGNDSNSGHMPWQAKKTISAALAQGYRNTTIFVAGGRYVETVDFSGAQQVRLIGLGGLGDSLYGATIQAPSDTAPAITLEGALGINEIAYFNLLGAGSFYTYGQTYTGTLLETGVTTGGTPPGQYVHDIVMYGSNDAGIPQPGTYRSGGVAYGGTGMHINNIEQSSFERIRFNYLYLGVLNEGENTNSQNKLDKLYFSSVYKVYKDGSQGAMTMGENSYSNWKTQTTFAYSHAVGILQSDGTVPADGDTVTANDQTYRFKTTMSQANDIQIGADANTTMLSLAHAVNQTGTPGTDYFAGTVAPTGISAGYVNLAGSGGGGGYFQDQVDTANNRMAFRNEDVVGPDGNTTPFTVSSSHLSAVNIDLSASTSGTFLGADWSMELHQGSQGRSIFDSIDGCEQMATRNGNCWLIDTDDCIFRSCANAPQTSVSVTGSSNKFERWNVQQLFVIQSGASANILDDPFGQTVTDYGTATLWLNFTPSSNPANAPNPVSTGNQPRSGYGPPQLYKAGVYFPVPGNVPLSTFTVVQSRTYLLPLFVPLFGRSLADLAVNITAGVAGATAYAALYRPGSDSLPSTWYGDGFSNLGASAASTGTISFGTVSNGNLSGLMWLAVGFLGGAPTVTGVAAGTPPTWLVASTTLTDFTSGGGQCYYQDGILSATGVHFSNVTALSVGSGAPVLFPKYN